MRELMRTGGGPDPFSSAVRATRMPMLITNPRLPDNPIVFANAAFARLTGYDRGDIIGRNCRFLQGEGTDRSDIARLRDAIASRTTIELELLNYKADRSSFWNRLLVSPVFDDDGVLTYFFASQMDVTLEHERMKLLERDRAELEAEVRRRTEDLIATEHRLSLALDAGRLGAWSIDLETGRLTASAQCKAICGRAPGDPMSLDDLRSTIHPDDLPGHIQAIEQAIAQRNRLESEYRLVLARGEERWVQISGQASYRADGTPIAVSGTTQDVTERRRSQEHRGLLARELAHRVKNTLAVMQGIVSQSLRRASSIEDADRIIQQRIQALGAAHDLLIENEFGTLHLRELLARTLLPFGGEDAARFSFEGPSVVFPSRLVTAYALAVHELATNAAKYGALSSDGGSIALSWSVEGALGSERLHFVWSEHGGPPVEAPAREGFGTRLLRTLLGGQTGGSVEVDYARTGVLVQAVTPLADD